MHSYLLPSDVTVRGTGVFASSGVSTFVCKSLCFALFSCIVSQVEWRACLKICFRLLLTCQVYAFSPAPIPTNGRDVISLSSFKLILKADVLS